jgi:hypothetical protein
VSSLGIMKKEVHITSSASVTNACHFRHALALDELRVKFMPEYFSEVNAHRSNIRRPRRAVSDVKEVWFAGCHSDVYVIFSVHTSDEPHAFSRPVVVPTGHVILKEHLTPRATNIILPMLATYHFCGWQGKLPTKVYLSNRTKLCGAHVMSISVEKIRCTLRGNFSRSCPFVTKYHSVVLVYTSGGNVASWWIQFHL